MGSGLNGNNFAFNGYLPIDKIEKKAKIKFLEKVSQKRNQSQIFIETPYRNNKMLEDLLKISRNKYPLLLEIKPIFNIESLKIWKFGQNFL